MYNTIFYKTVKSFERAINDGKKNNSILETYYPTLSITYNDGIVIKRNKVIKKIIEFSGFTNQYISGIFGVDTGQKKIYINEILKWLNYKNLNKNKFFIKKNTYPNDSFTLDNKKLMNSIKGKISKSEIKNFCKLIGKKIYYRFNYSI